MTILRQLHELTGSYSLLFPGQQNAERPMSENTINKALRLVGYGADRPATASAIYSAPS